MPFGQYPFGGLAAPDGAKITGFGAGCLQIEYFKALPTQSGPRSKRAAGPHAVKACKADVEGAA
jgi:hypothetical protein